MLAKTSWNRQSFSRLVVAVLAGALLVLPAWPARADDKADAAQLVEKARLTFESFVERELVLIKVQTNADNRSEIMQIAEIFRAKVVDISPRTLRLEATGSRQKVDAITKMLKPFAIREIARTGRVALKREFQGEV